MTTSKLRPLTLRPHEARRLAECGEVVVARMVKPQPEMRQCDGYDKPMPFIPHDESGKLRRPFGDVGDRFWCRETADLQSFCGWNVPDAEMVIRYAAGGTKTFIRPNSLPYDLTRAVGAACMPQWASRFTVEVSDVACRQPTAEDKATIAGVEDGTWHWFGTMRRIEG